MECEALCFTKSHASVLQAASYHSRPLCILKHKAALRSGTSVSDLNPQNKCQDQICQQTRRKSAPWEQICSLN